MEKTKWYFLRPDTGRLEYRIKIGGNYGEKTAQIDVYNSEGDWVRGEEGASIATADSLRKVLVEQGYLFSEDADPSERAVRQTGLIEKLKAHLHRNREIRIRLAEKYGDEGSRERAIVYDEILTMLESGRVPEKED